jgi:catechol 2,3-dioxygenase-like lactoylglutathione lyase family enzyme
MHIRHIFLEVTDLKRAVAFYCDLLAGQARAGVG